jgi:predicted dithiol-disulfide oxidoreductase (DUF899 family)
MEFFEVPPSGWQDDSDDHSQVRWGESRKTKLLLKEINKLRRMQEVQAYERAIDLKKIRKQYAPAQGGPGL